MDPLSDNPNIYIQQVTEVNIVPYQYKARLNNLHTKNIAAKEKSRQIPKVQCCLCIASAYGHGTVVGAFSGIK